MALECYRFVFCRLLLQKYNVCQDLVKIDADQIQASGRGKIKELLDNPVNPLDLLEDNTGTLPQFIIFCQLHLQKLRRSSYSTKWVFNLVCEPGSQSPES